MNSRDKWCPRPSGIHGEKFALVLCVGTLRVGLWTKSDHQELRSRCDRQTDGRVSRVLAIVRNGRGPGVCSCIMIYVLFFLALPEVDI